jgi:hypothetical protein
MMGKDSLTREDIIVSLGDLPCRGHEERPCEVCRRLRKNAGIIGHRNSKLCRGGQIDVVISDPIVGIPRRLGLTIINFLVTG